jgi:predicted Zn-dependent protease
MGLGRLALDSDPAQALAYFDRAATADPGDPAPHLLAARALVASGKPDAANERLDALLKEHPVEVEAAMLCASLDLDRGLATDRTLERARRAVRFGGGIPALELLERVYTTRGESDQAERIAARARALREKGEKADQTASEG